ncbi:tyrosine-protein phosphatase [Novosphingobium sp.]|uniref:tyrosine-protein phosphatase n=1 Tax=Novosphingobium sp. TaxID=1874826 RepID=UPI0035B4F681
MTRLKLEILSLVLAALSANVAAAPPTDATVERNASGAVFAYWTSADPVDVFVADRADAGLKSATLVSRADTDGSATLPTGDKRSYVLLRDPRSGQVVRVAERLVPLERGSNFRDIGGYAVAGGRHVRWGLIYRSGATPMLSERDREQIRALVLTEMIDLRSDEERVLAPSRIDGVHYSAVGYSMTSLNFTASVTDSYRAMPLGLRPQLRLLFASLLRGDGPLVYNCSAGQDRTGIATALILSARGAPGAARVAAAPPPRDDPGGLPPLDPLSPAAERDAADRPGAGREQSGRCAVREIPAGR